MKLACSVEVECHCVELKASLALKPIKRFSKQEARRQKYEARSDTRNGESKDYFSTTKHDGKIKKQSANNKCE